MSFIVLGIYTLFTNIININKADFYTFGLEDFILGIDAIVNACSIFWLQISEAVQGDENQSASQLVPANPQGPPLPAHSDPPHHPQGLEVRQHFYHRSDGIGQDRGPGPGYAQTRVIRQECHRYDPKSPPPVCRCAAPPGDTEVFPEGPFMLVLNMVNEAGTL